MKMNIRSYIIDWLFICLMNWYAISGFLGIFNIGYVFRIYFILSFLFFLTILYNERISIVFYKLLGILLLWLLYLYLYHYHTQIEPPVPYNIMKDKIMDAAQIFPQTFFYIGSAVYIYRNYLRLDVVLYNLMIISLSLMLLLILAIYYTQGPSFFVLEAQMIKGTTVSIITVSYSLAFCAVLALYMILEKKNNVAWFCFILSVVTILILGKRGSLLSVASAGISLYIFYNKNIWGFLWRMTAIIVLYIVFIQNVDYIFDFFSIFSERLAQESKMAFLYGDTNGREDLWNYAIEQIGISPIWGTYPKVYYMNANLWGWGMHPHNIYLEALMTMGIVGTVPFVFFIIWTLNTKIYKSISKGTPYCFFGMLFIAELVHGFFSGTLYSSWVWFLLFVFSYDLYKESREKNIRYHKLSNFRRKRRTTELAAKYNVSRS